MKLIVQKIHEKAILPKYAHSDDAGMDLFSIEETLVAVGERKLIRTGIAIQLPPNTEAQVRPRSGLALKNGITLLNSPGTIDEGFRGEVKIIVINHGEENFLITQGMKIAQMVINTFVKVDIEEAERLNESERGNNGFGSTGI